MYFSVPFCIFFSAIMAQTVIDVKLVTQDVYFNFLFTCKPILLSPLFKFKKLGQNE